MLSIRLRRMGSTKKPYFRVVVTEARSARDSSFVENVGTYHPRAKPSDSVRTLIARHLSRDLSAPAAGTPAAQ